GWAIARPISKWNSPCGSSATLRYIALTLASRSLGSKVANVPMGLLLNATVGWVSASRVTQAECLTIVGLRPWAQPNSQCSSKAERRRAGFDALVHHAGAGDLNAVDEILLLVATRLDAGRTGPQATAAREKVFHQRCQRLQRMHDQVVDGAFAHQVDPVVRQEDRDLQSRGDAAIGDGEGHRRQLVVGPMRNDHNKFTGGFCHMSSPASGGSFQAQAR